ncbi:MAG TPA: hypothetical protein VOB72_09075 [Candidatus Dormibacteraeota bacterium]|nr:hypothetical protein [Candidatus Dormibacteraeota bacterium]
MTDNRDCREVREPDRNLSLPLVDRPGCGLWAGIEATQRDQHVWPALVDALSEAGRKYLWNALREAVDATPDDPERALMVVEAFHRTMLLRRDPGYEQRMWSEGGPVRFYSPSELRQAIEE